MDVKEEQKDQTLLIEEYQEDEDMQVSRERIQQKKKNICMNKQQVQMEV